MASDVRMERDWRRSPVRYLMWSLAGFLLALPAVAMQFTSEVDWSGSDFLIMGAMLATACGLVELGARASRSPAYRIGVGLAVLAAFLLLWINLAVGIIGSEDNPANLMFAGVLAVAIGGSVLALGKPRQMMLAMGAVALSQAVVGAIALTGDSGAEEPNTRGAVIFLTVAFTGMWLVSAALFRLAANEQ